MEVVLGLHKEGATVPFMARYRKEATGNLNEVEIQQILDAHEAYDTLLSRKAFVLSEIERQKKLTPELKVQIEQTFDAKVLEDLYLPFKVKRKTKAQAARDAGLEPLADWIWNTGHGLEKPQDGQTLELWAFTFRSEEKDIPDAAAAIKGAEAILIERLSETLALRQLVRAQLFEHGFLETCKGKSPKANSKFESYFVFREKITSLLDPRHSHRYLAIRRGVHEEELKMSLVGDANDPQWEAKLLQAFEAHAVTVPDAPGREVLLRAARLSFKAHVFTSIESEVHQALREVADKVAIDVFAQNLKQLLLASPYGAKGVLGVDPGIRTGCKLAVINDSGKFVANAVIHIQSDEQRIASATLLKGIALTGQISAVAVGNGTGGREVEHFIRKIFGENAITIPVVMVSEAGASVYSASEAAREEFPDLDLTVRGAISIARRFQDPLAELVKIEPKSIGVGQYQHDVSQPALKRSLHQVVESCVNQVGVNLNTASVHLLSYVSGIGPAAARSLVTRRESKGLFQSRQELMETGALTKKVFEQAAGFLRVPNSEEVLDQTGVHPERYETLKRFAETQGHRVNDYLGEGVKNLKAAEPLKAELGEHTFKDILQELEKPGLDPRSHFVPIQFNPEVCELKDLKLGMQLQGVVTNVTNFGAFVDVGVHQDGLVHISQLADQFVDDPRKIIQPGDRVKVRVLEVNMEKRQIALSMRRKPVVGAKDGQKQRFETNVTMGGRKKPPVPKSFNTPFAGLASLKDKLKK
jgi:protein Tex